MNKEVLETYTMTKEEEIKWLRQCVRELQEKRDKYKSVIDKIKEYLEITKLIYDDDTCVMLCETWYGKELMKLLEEIE